jgi:hypothetical protein
MAIEIVNGYPCKNCTDVDYAKKNIDPAHPKDGPNGVNAPDKAGKTDKAHGAEKPGDPAQTGKPDFGPAVTLSGALAQVTQAPKAETPQAYRPGATVSLSA